MLLTGKEEYTQRESGLIVPKRKRPTAIDLFCGIGGFSLGLLQAGYEVVAAADWDCGAMTTYLANLGSYPINMHFIENEDKERYEKHLEDHIKRTEKETGIAKMPTSGCSHTGEYPPVRNVWIGDIKKLTGKEILDKISMEVGEVDLVVGGPPCQGFSTAGKREVMDPRNSLVFEFARMILEIYPKSMVMENVPGIVSMVTPEGIPVVDAFCRMLEDGNYGAFESLRNTILNTSGAGAAMKNQKTGTKKDRESAKGKDPGDKDDSAEQMEMFG